MKDVVRPIASVLALGALGLGPLGWHPCLFAAEAQVHCDEPELRAAAERFLQLAQPLYPESKDKVTRLVDKAKAAAVPKESCDHLIQARDFLARLEGPRVISATRPDPKAYPERFTKCSDAKAVADKLHGFIKQKEDRFYPKARIQVRSLLSAADKLALTDPAAACVLYDELRNYIVDLWPEVLKTLK